jgi:uncharacterized membrane protein
MLLQYVKAFFLLILLDIPWLTYQMSNASAMLKKIQGGRDVMIRPWPAVIVYAALAFLLLQQTSVKQAAASGAATYAVYDFTNMLTFKDYNLSFAIQDSLWGGVLFAMAYKIMQHI